ncbi:hypothetical protein [Lactococcus lactis]|uniref:hypothetical protein n=1 Tax=Lactococcus lactis TaxID=1358 RepID=UPI0021A5CD5D|nr:hypothetical protein [Lactococcus lactis]
MALFVFPLKSINGSNMYNNDDFRQYFANFISTGILANVPLAGSTAFQVTQTDSPSMNVIVGSGVAWIIGGQVMNTSPLSFKIPAPLTSQSRTDSIVVQWSNSSNNGDIVYKQNSTKVVQSNDVYELQLCKILVPANATNISQSNITDMRADPTVCGFSSPYEAIKTGDLLAQFKSELEANGVLFSEWFETIKGQLSEDAAGHLQVQLDNLNAQVVKISGDQDISGGKNFTDDTKMNNLELTGKLTRPNKKVLLSGAFWMQSGQVVTPSKAISDCENGWILHFTSYNSGMTGETKNGNNHYFYVPKEQVNIADVGTMFPLVVTDGTMTLKYLYLQNNKITGNAANESTNSKKYVLQHVIEY